MRASCSAPLGLNISSHAACTAARSAAVCGAGGQAGDLGASISSEVSAFWRIMLLRHVFLFLASAVSSSKPNSGASIAMLPGRFSCNCALTASLTYRCPSSLKICPSHLYRRFLISATRSYVLVLADASSCADLSVIWERHLALQPFIIAIVFSSSRHASLPYVMRLHTAVL